MPLETAYSVRRLSTRAWMLPGVYLPRPERLPALRPVSSAIPSSMVVARFWLKRGVDGFRLDTINFYFADKYLRDNPSLPKELRNNSIAPSVNPYNHQLHLFSKNQPEILEFLKRFRAVLTPYNAAAVGEVGDAQRGLEIMAEYTSGGDKVQMCYPFEMLQPTRLTAALMEDAFARMARAAPDAWPCWSYSNHDTCLLYTSDAADSDLV